MSSYALCIGHIKFPQRYPRYESDMAVDRKLAFGFGQQQLLEMYGLGLKVGYSWIGIPDLLPPLQAFELH